ncbi:BLUF domain-containing protein [Hyphococcus sp.]|jgi:hypothetical protein|uniref:BLUF domain-containing protein n=1 Tax=Hyphococcus sp. TaxID=2038636 RepID=UPI003D0C9A1A
MEIVVYASASVLASPDLESILEVSRRNNGSNGLTGVLLFAEGNFLQALEGPTRALDKTYARIVNDARHRQIIELYRMPIEERHFPTWSMGCPMLTTPRAPAAAFDLTRDSLEAMRRDDRGEEILTLLKSFYKVANRNGA